MPSPVITATTHRTDDNEQVVLYQAAGYQPMAKNLISAALRLYPASTKADITLTVNSDMQAEKSEALLKSQNIPALRDRSTGTSLKLVHIKNVDHENGMISAMLALGSTPESQGGINPRVADQVITHELARTNRKASETELAALKVEVISRREYDTTGKKLGTLAKSLPVIEMDVMHPFSTVTYLKENSGLYGKTTRIGLKGMSDAIDIMRLLNSKDIETSAPTDYKGDAHFNAFAPADKLAALLAEAGYLPQSIAQELVDSGKNIEALARKSTATATQTR